MIALAAAALFSGCAKEEGPVDPYSVNWCYLQDPSMTTFDGFFTAASGWVVDYGENQTITQARCTKPAPQDIKVKLKIDASLVAEYNQKHETEYEMMTGVQLAKTVLTIPEGKYVSADTLTVMHNEHADLIENGTKSYLLPIVVESVEGPATQSEKSVIYLVYNASKVLGRILTDYVGTQLDRTNWVVTQNGTDITEYAVGGWDTYIREGDEIILDMGAKYDVRALGIQFYNYYYYYAAYSFKLSYSEDGVTYTDAGEYFNENSSSLVIVEVFDNLPGRYIKIVIGQPFTSWGMYLDELYATVL